MTTERERLARALQPELERAGWTLSLGAIYAVLDALDFHTRATTAASVHADPTGKTREPPHCPTCACGL